MAMGADPAVGGRARQHDVPCRRPVGAVGSEVDDVRIEPVPVGRFRVLSVSAGQHLKSSPWGHPGIQRRLPFFNARFGLNI